MSADSGMATEYMSNVKHYPYLLGAMDNPAHIMYAGAIGTDAFVFVDDNDRATRN